MLAEPVEGLLDTEPEALPHEPERPEHGGVPIVRQLAIEIDDRPAPAPEPHIRIMTGESR
jgi:hypothetical protein